MGAEYFMGIDLGSTTAKTVIIDGSFEILAAETVQMGAVSRKGLQRSVAAAMESAGLELGQILRTVSTGYGRRLVPEAGRTFTEITCHARGAAQLLPDVRLVVDVGGQDSKAILVNSLGLVDDFAMNDRCASGTGRFYEVLARALEVDISEIGALALAGGEDLEVSSMCATFAETEIIALLAGGAAPADIAASVHRAVAQRAVGLVSRVGRKAPIAMTGGVARNPAAVHFLSEALGRPIVVPSDPQIVGAYGAAILALESGPSAAAASPLPQLEERVDETFAPENRPGGTCAGCSGELGAGTHSHRSVVWGPDIPVRSPLS